MKLPSFLLSAFLVAGCGSTQRLPDQLPEIRSVALVSAVPESANYERIGLTVFSNESRPLLDMGGATAQAIFETTTARISTSKPGWKVTALPYAHRPCRSDLPAQPCKTTEQLRADFLALARENGADAILAFYPFGPSDVNLKFAIGSYGVGVFERPLPGLPKRGVLHANFTVELLDNTGKVLARGASLYEHIQTRQIDTAATPIGQAVEPSFTSYLVGNLKPVIQANTLVRLQEIGL